MKLALLALLAAVFSPPLLAAVDPADHPLLEFARDRQSDRTGDARQLQGAPGAREAEHALERARVPPDEQCASTLGAARYAALHADVAVARALDGDFAGAAAAYRRAHACRPRDADILAALGGVLFDARDFTGARAAIDAALAIDPRSVSTNRIAGNLDFLAEHWADAISRFRYVAASDPDRRLAGYGQLMYFLAQYRAGVQRPEFVQRTPGDGWPQPLLLYLRGEYTEAELLMPIRDGDEDYDAPPNNSTDERLCEALYYVGQAYWARGQPDVALEYFTALVNIKVIYFLEHGLALADIAKLRKRLPR